MWLRISHNALLFPPSDSEADFISTESLGLTLRWRPRRIDIVTYNYVRAIHRGNSGVYSNSVGRVNFREGSPFADPRAKRGGWQGGRLSGAPRGWTRYLPMADRGWKTSRELDLQPTNIFRTRLLLYSREFTVRTIDGCCRLLSGHRSVAVSLVTKRDVYSR